MRPGRALLGDAMIYTLANLATAAIPFLMLPVLTRFLSPAEYGTVAMFSACVAFFSALAGVNVHGAIGMRYFDREAIDFPRYVAGCLLILMVSTGVVLVLVRLFMPVLTELTRLPPLYLALAVLLAGSQFVVQSQLAIWQSSKRPWKYGALRFGQALLDASATLGLVVLAGAAWEGRVAGIALAAGCAALAAGSTLWRSGWIRFPADRDLVRNALRFGLPLVPHTVGGILSSMSDRFLVTNLIDLASTGIYMVALQVGMVLGILTDSFNRAFAPWLIEALKREDARRDVVIVRFTYGYFAVVLALSALVTLFAPVLLGLLAGERYLQAVPLIGYIMVGFAFGGMYYMVTNYIFFAGRTELLSVLTFVTGVANVAICYALLKHNGIVGAAQGFMITQGLVLLGAWWLAQRCRPMPWRSGLSLMRA